MNYLSCEMCSVAFSEECQPKILDCGHSVCSKCVAILLNNENKCSFCYVKLSKSLDEYPTNFAILWISVKKLESNSVVLELASLEKKKNLLLSMKETSEKLINMKSSFKTAAADFIGKFQELMPRSTELSHDCDDKNLIADIDIGKKDNVLDHSYDSTLRNIFHLKKDDDKKKILRLLQHHLHLNIKIFACEIVGNLLWKYGQVTFSEDRFHVHCLSSSTLEKDASVVSLQDLRVCMEKDVTPFIRVGNQMLVFTLRKDLSVWGLQLIKYLTGEAGLILNGCKAEVSRYIASAVNEDERNISFSTTLNLCSIPIPSTRITCRCVNEFQFHENICTKVNQGVIVLQFFAGCIKIFKVPETDQYPAVVGKLHQHCPINFNEMKEKKVEDCGISFI